jgi:hypothetical protein
MALIGRPRAKSGGDRRFLAIELQSSILKFVSALLAEPYTPADEYLMPGTTNPFGRAFVAGMVDGGRKEFFLGNLFGLLNNPGTGESGGHAWRERPTVICELFLSGTRKVTA